MLLEETPFRKGLYMKVPKGTELQVRYRYDDNRVLDKTSREVVVEITDVVIPHHYLYLTEEELAEEKKLLEAIPFANHELYTRLPKHTVSYPNGRGGQTYTREELTPEAAEEYNTAVHAGHLEMNRIRNHYKDLGDARITPDDLLICWSSEYKMAKAKDVTLAEKPAARMKQPKVNIRQQMVPKSRWKFTKDVDIMYGAPNPAYHKMLKDWADANPQPQLAHNASQASQTAWRPLHDAWHASYTANRKLAEDTHGLYVPQLYRSIKAGEIFTVTDKFSSFFMPYGWDGERYGNVASAQFDGENKAVGLEYSLIKDAIEADSLPVVKAFVLRHKKTGQFYKGSSYDQIASERRKRERIEAGEDLQPWHREWVSVMDFGDTFMKGKKWDNLGKAKTSILIMTGYYEGLPGADEALPDWGGAVSMSDDELRQFELVEFNKLDRQEVGVVADFMDWFEHTWKLRELTMKYGSSVRTVYKALEKAKMLDTQKGVAVFTVTDQDALDKVHYWGDRTALTDADKEDIKLALSSVEGKFKQAVDHKSAAVSFPNKSAAMMFKLAYMGNLKVSVIDLEDMKEAVGD